MIPMNVRVPVPAEFVFPHGALCLGVEPVRDFDAKGKDDQARDKDSGERVWQVRVLDLDPEAGRFGEPKEVKVKIAASVAPVPPESSAPGYPPMVTFTDVVLTPYVNSQRRCTDRCRARLAWSIRAGSMVPARSTASVGAAGGKPAAGRSAKAAA